MTKSHILSMALVMCAALAAAADSAGAADVLEVVPSDAMGVLVINNLGQTDAKVQQLAGQLQLPQVAMLTKIKSDLGLDQGIDDTGSLALAAVVPGDGTAPAAVAYVPTDDYPALLKQLNASAPANGVARFTVPEGDPALIAELGGFAVITEGSNRAALEAALSMKRSIAAETPSLEAWRTETQVYAIATPAGVRFAQQQILTGLAVAKQQVQQAGPQAEQAVFGIEIYENLFQNLDREVTYAAVGLRIEDSGDVRIIGRTLLAEGGVLASMTAGAKPGSADVLAGLPKMPFVFAGGGVMSPEATEPLMKASIGMMKLYPGGKDMTEEQTEKLVEVSAASMRGMRSMSMMMGVGQGDEPLYSSMFIVIKADDAQAYLQNYLDTVREMDEIFSSSEFPFSYEVEEMQFAGRRGLKLSMDMSGMFGQQEVPEAEKMMELMFGEGDTMDVYMAVADEQTVLGAYVSQANLTDVLESYVQGQNQLSEMPQVASTVSKLDSDAQTIGLWSPQGTLAMISRLASAIDPAAAAQIPELGATPPIGFTISSSPGVLDTEAIIPAEMLKTVAAMVQQLMPQVPPPEEQF